MVRSLLISLLAGVMVSAFAPSDAYAQVILESRGGAQRGSGEGEQSQSPSRRRSTGSIYRQYGSAVFARGGLFFADTNTLTDVSQPYGSLGYRQIFAAKGKSIFSWEGEVLGARDSETLPTGLMGSDIDVSSTLIAGLASARWDYVLSEVLSPFVSAGIGIAYVRGSVDDGVASISNDDFEFAYTGRAGLAVNVTDQLGLEAAYRFVGVTAGTDGFHGGELGLNYRF